MCRFAFVFVYFFGLCAPSSALAGEEEPVLFADGLVQTVNGISFSDDGTTVYVSLRTNAVDESGRRRVGLYSRHMTADGTWGEPLLLPFSGRYTDYQPKLSFDGRWLFYTSTRPLPGTTDEVRQNVWYVAHAQTGWGEPRPLEAGVSPAWDGHAVLDADGQVYFASDRGGGMGLVDIYEVRFDPQGPGGAPRNLEQLNSGGSDNDMALHPNGQYMVLTRFLPASEDLDLFLSQKTSRGWSVPVPLRMLNTDAWELSPGFSPDGEIFYFLRAGVSGIIQVPFASLLATP